ncbi:MAG: MFS transporter [Patescibacteria group bacterium]
MLTKLKELASSFFPDHIRRQIRELYAATTIFNLAVALVNIFEPVFLYLFFSKFFDLKTTLSLILWFYFIIYVLYFFTLPLGAKFAKRFGYEYSIALSTVFAIALYFFLLNMGVHHFFVFGAIISYVAFKLFYWPAYHSNFANFSSAGEEGREISNLLVLGSIVCIAGPFIGGVILQFWGFNALFVLVAILMLVSNIPMLITKEKFESKPFSYLGAYKRLWHRPNRRHFFAHWGFGEELIVLVIWPIFMYIIARDFLNLGVLAAVSTCITTLILLFIGRQTDKGNRRNVLRAGAVFYFFSWLLRLLTRGIFGVLILDVYSRVTKEFIAIPITAVTYEKAQDESVMKTIMFFEMSLVVGKIVAIVLGLILLQFFAPGWNALFILAGIMTLFYLLF